MENKSLVIFVDGFVDVNTGNLKIGGIQTYVYNLSLLAKNNGFEVIVVQFASKRERVETEYEGIKVITRYGKGNSGRQKCFDEIYREKRDNAVYIISSDQYDIRSQAPYVITIQHGIAFDIPAEMIKGFWGLNKLTIRVNKLLRCIKNVERFGMTRNTVCVDYNYYNWFRTFGTIDQSIKKVKVIPNYSNEIISKTEFESKLTNRQKCRSIIFARRFTDYRGTLLFSRVIERLISENFQFEVTFAGEGPLKQYLIDTFKDCTNVKITSFNAVDSVSVHKLYDIAVVPTVFSEGTSLSLCEAMAAGCFPVCTHVGGMTNMIIDHFNGIMCQPDENSLYSSMIEVLTMPQQEFDAISRQSFLTASSAFKIGRWQEQWIKFIDEIIGNIS